MEQMNAKERLKQYIEKDEIYQNYKQNKLMNSNDFDKFCIQHCKDIEELLEENEELKQKYLNAVADYEKTEFEKERLNSLVNSCQEEIRQLKKQVENKYEKVGTLTNEILYEENTKLYNENRKLKKQLKPNYYVKGLEGTCKEYQQEMNNIANQQKEFINYLEDEIKTLEKDILETVEDMDIYMKQVKSLIIEEILQKYKSIIGDNN